MKLSIIIPVFNEEKNIQKAVDKIETEVTAKHQLLIIYDNSKDTTLPPARQLAKKYSNLKLLQNNHGNGRGVINAIKTGFDYVREGAVVVMMADLADDPQTVNKMMAKINQGYDIVCASRYSKGGKHLGGPVFKSILSWLADVTAPYILGIPTFDLTNAFKMYKKEVLEAILIQSQGGFELSMEIVIKAHFKGFKITEVGTVWHDRSQGESNFKLWQWLPKYIYWYCWAFKKKNKIF